MGIKYSGLKCDAENCGYKDKTIERKDFETSINKPCPNCGGNLLTLEDYLNVLILEEIAEQYKDSLENPDEEMTTVRVNTHKTLSIIEDGEI